MIRNTYYNSEPLIFHCPFVEDRFGREPLLWKQLLAEQIQECKLPDDLTIFTWNSKPATSVLELQLNALGLPYTVLGKNVQVWRNCYKPKLLLDSLPNTKYVLALDAYDVVLVRSLETIVERFEQYNCKVLFNAQDRPWPPESPLFEDVPFGYLNSGAFIGETEYLRELFIEYQHIKPITHRNSDQGIINQQMIGNPDTKLDYRCSVFQCSLTSEHVELV